jgi:hypothetical protein
MDYSKKRDSDEKTAVDLRWVLHTYRLTQLYQN